MLYIVLVVLHNFILCHISGASWTVRPKEMTPDLIPLRNFETILEYLQNPKWKVIPGISKLIHTFYHECQGNKLPITKFANETHHYPFIVICGFGGSERPTVIQEVRKRLNWVFLEDPPPCLAQLWRLFKRHSVRPRRAFKALSIYVNTILIRDYAEKVGVITNWYWVPWLAEYIGTVVNNYLTLTTDPLPVNVSDLYKFPVDQLKPDLTIYLHVTNETYLNWAEKRKIKVPVIRPIDEVVPKMQDPSVVPVLSGVFPSETAINIIRELHKRKLVSDDEMQKALLPNVY